MSAKESFASPAPWAVFAFATTSFFLGYINAGLISGTAVFAVLPMALIFGGLCQLIVAIIEIARGNGFTGTVFGIYGPFWIVYGLFVKFFIGSIPTANQGAAVSLFLFMFAVLSTFLFIASLRTDRVLVVIFFLIALALALLGIGAATGASGWTTIGGWVTLVFAVLAWYHALAGLLTMTWGRAVLPLGVIGPLPSKGTNS
jgi:succinate-acetate transporter protein